MRIPGVKCVGCENGEDVAVESLDDTSGVLICRRCALEFRASPMWMRGVVLGVIQALAAQRGLRDCANSERVVLFVTETDDDFHVAVRRVETGSRPIHDA